MQNPNGFVAEYFRKHNPDLSVLRTSRAIGLTNTAALYRFFRAEFQWLGVAKQEKLAKLLSTKRRAVSVKMIKRDILRRKTVASQG